MIKYFSVLIVFLWLLLVGCDVTSTDSPQSSEESTQVSEYHIDALVYYNGDEWIGLAYLYYWDGTTSHNLPNAEVSVNEQTLEHQSDRFREGILSGDFTPGDTFSLLLVDGEHNLSAETTLPQAVIPNEPDPVGTSINVADDLELSWTYDTLPDEISVNISSYYTLSGDFYEFLAAPSTQSHTVPGGTFKSLPNVSLDIKALNSAILSSGDFTEGSKFRVENETVYYFGTD